MRSKRREEEEVEDEEECERFKGMVLSSVTMMEQGADSSGSGSSNSEEELKKLVFFAGDFRRRLRNLERGQPVNSRRIPAMMLKYSVVKEKLNRLSLIMAVKKGEAGLKELKELYVDWKSSKETLDEMSEVLSLLSNPTYSSSSAATNTTTTTNMGVYSVGATEYLRDLLELLSEQGNIIEVGAVMNQLCLGADPNVVNSKGESGIQLACRYNMGDLCDIFLNFEETDPSIADIEYKRNAIHFAAARMQEHYGFEELCEFVKEQPSKLDMVDRSGMNALQFADLSYSKSEILLRFGANPNIKFRVYKNKTRMHMIMQENYTDKFLHLLIKYKGDINMKDDDGNTPLHYAVSLGRLSAVKILISYGVDVLAANKLDKTPLEFAVRGTRIYEEIQVRVDQWRERQMAMAMINHRILRRPGFYDSFDQLVHGGGDKKEKKKALSLPNNFNYHGGGGGDHDDTTVVIPSDILRSMSMIGP